MIQKKKTCLITVCVDVLI